MVLLCLCQLLVAPVSWLMAALFQPVPASSYGLPHCVGVFCPVSYRDTCHQIKGPFAIQHGLISRPLIPSAKILFPNNVTMTGHRTYLWGGRPQFNKLQMGVIGLVSENGCKDLTWQGLWSCLLQSSVDVKCWFSPHFFSRCLCPQEGLALPIHNEVGWDEGFLLLAYLHWRGFPFQRGVKEGKSSFFQGFPFLSSGALQESFIIFPPGRSWPAAPLQSWSPPTLIYSYPDMHTYQVLSPYTVINAGVSGSRGVGEPANPVWAIFRSSDSSLGTPIHPQSASMLFLIISWLCAAKQRRLLRPLPFSVLPVEMCLSSRCWGAWARYWSGGKKQACQETA